MTLFLLPLQSGQEFSGLQSLCPSNTSSEECHTRNGYTWQIPCPALSRGSQMVGFVGSATTSQERDVGDCGCTWRWTQSKLPAGSPASSPAPGLASPSRSSGNPKKMYKNTSLIVFLVGITELICLSGKK